MIKRFATKTLDEIEKNLNENYLNKIDILVKFYNIVQQDKGQKSLIYENTIKNLRHVIPVKEQLTAGFNSGKDKTFIEDDKFFIYTDKQLYSFSTLNDKYCILKINKLAQDIFNFLNKDFDKDFEAYPNNIDDYVKYRNNLKTF